MNKTLYKYILIKRSINTSFFNVDITGTKKKVRRTCLCVILKASANVCSMWNARGTGHAKKILNATNKIVEQTAVTTVPSKINKAKAELDVNTEVILQHLKVVYVK
jgi:hypothetical protein